MNQKIIKQKKRKKENRESNKERKTEKLSETKKIKRKKLKNSGDNHLIKCFYGNNSGLFMLL